MTKLKKYLFFLVTYFAIGLICFSLSNIYTKNDAINTINRGLYSKDAIYFQLSTNKKDFQKIKNCIKENQILYMEVDTDIKGVYMNNAKIPFIDGSVKFNENSSNKDFVVGKNILDKYGYKKGNSYYVNLFNKEIKVTGKLNYSIPTILDDFILLNDDDFFELFLKTSLIVLDGNNVNESFKKMQNCYGDKIKKIDISNRSKYNNDNSYTYILIISYIVMIILSLLLTKFFIYYKKKDIFVLNILGFSKKYILFYVISRYLLLILIGYSVGSIFAYLCVTNYYCTSAILFYMFIIIVTANILILFINVINTLKNKKNKKDSLTKYLIITTISFVFILCNLTISSKLKQDNNYSALNNIIMDDNRYDLSDEVEGFEEHELLNSTYRIQNLNKYYKELSSWDGYDYYIQQFPWLLIKIDKDIGNYEVFRYGYEEGKLSDDYTSIFNGETFTTVKAITMNKLQFDKYSFEIYKGRMFNKDDYMYKSLERIPVILGYEYSNIYKIGDIIKSSHIATFSTFEVVGFLKKGESANDNNELLVLDRYVIIPNLEFNFSPKTDNEIFFYGANLLNSINGDFILRKGHSIDEVCMLIDNLSRKYSIPTTEICQLPSASESMLYIINENNKVSMYVITFILVIFSVLILSLFIILDIDKNKMFYSVNLLCGYDKRYILYKIILKYTMIWISSHLIAGFISIQFINYNIVWIVISGVLFIAGIIPIKKFIDKLPVINILKGEH